MPGKTVYIGETGYPSAGKQRERAQPAHELQRRGCSAHQWQ